MSVTTVPIQPLKKGSIGKFWIGISAVILAGAGLAYWGTSSIRSEYAGDEAFLADNADEDGVTVTKSGLQFKTIRGGEGKSPTDDDITLIKYTGTLRDGSVFDQNERAPMPVAGVVPGFSEALKKMQIGGQYKIWIPGKLGYGENPPPNPQTGQPAFKPNETLIFDVELLDFRSRAEVEAMQKEMEAQQKKQGGGAPQGGGQAGVQGGLPPELQAQLEAQMRQQAQ